MSKDNSDLNGCCWVGVLVVFFGFAGIRACGAGGGSSASSSDTSSPSLPSRSSSSGASSSRMDSHEGYIRASEAERRQWAAEKEAELRRKGINNTSAKDLKDAMDSFYSR